VRQAKTAKLLKMLLEMELIGLGDTWKKFFVAVHYWNLAVIRCGLRQITLAF